METRNPQELGDGYKMFYYEINAKRNRVQLVLDSELQSNILVVKGETTQNNVAPFESKPTDISYYQLHMHPR